MNIASIIENLYKSPILYCITLLIVVALLRKGLFKINIGGLHLGRSSENERLIISRQINYVTLHIEMLQNEMCNKLTHINKYHIKYCMEKVLDEIVRRIAVNHISDDDVYIEDTVNTLIAITRKRSKDQFFYTKDFEDYVYKEVDKMIKQCLSIRKRMTK